MKRFAFSLQAVLDMRKHREDELKRVLAGQLNQIHAAQRHMAALAESLRDFQNNERELRAQAKNVVQLRHSVNYRNKVKLEMLAIGRQLDQMRGDAENTRSSLVEATQQRRAIELLKEKRFLQWRKQVSAQEQGSIDDVSQNAFIRKKFSLCKYAGS
ncbi:MAG: flagellar export protein FliJ [Chitinivibrionales bacterium]